MTPDDDSFCPDPLWSRNLTWDTSNPELTRCMRSTLLPLLPGAILLVWMPFWVRRAYKISRRTSAFPLDRSLSTLAWSQLILCVLLCISAVVRFLADTNMASDGDVYPSDYLSLVAQMTSLPLSAAIIVTDKLVGQRALIMQTSPLTFCFWLTYSLCWLPTFKADVEEVLSDHKPESGIYARAFLAASFLAAPIQLLLACKSDVKSSSSDHGLPPEERSSFVSLLLFAWLGKLIHQGFRRTLRQQDLPSNPSHAATGVSAAQFSSTWSKESEESRGAAVSLWRVLRRIYGRRFLWANVIYLVHVLLGFVNPQILRLVIRHVDSPDDEGWKGYLYAGTLLISSVLYSFAFNHSVHQLTIVGAQLRGGLVSAIYAKSLRLSADSRASFSSGEISNFVSVDSQLLFDSVPYANHLWADPVIVVLTIAFLYAELGPSALGGIAFLVMLVPFNFYGSKKIEEYQDKILASKDERMKITNETLSGILLIKMFAWENAFKKRIEGFRNAEVTLLRKMAKLFALSACTFSCSPIFVSLMVFGLYIAVDSVNHVLTPEKIFVSISLFSILRMPLELFPVVLFDVIRLGVSLGRIEKFLNAEELDPEAVEKETVDDYNDVEILSGSFSWGRQKDATLADINVTIQRGSLVAIVGKVGAGKSSLLSAMNGEMVKDDGSVRVGGNIAYVPQQAWIQNDTVQNNIVFGGPEEPARYRSILKACGLQEDLSLLPAGDKTEIGEEGVNLSGGQKQRVSLARAVYSDRDIYLLDDPLSAVDANVGSHIFDEVISSEHGLLKDKTRVLVTHGIHFLERVNEIIVLDNGRIIEQGRYDDLMSYEGVFADLIKEYGRMASEEEGHVEDKMLEMELKRKHLISQSSVTSHDDVTHPLLRDGAAGQLIGAEQVMVGKVRWSVYIDYMKVIGLSYSVCMLLLFALGQMLHVGSTIWLSNWSSHNTDHNDRPVFHMSVFGAIGLTETVVAYSRQVLLYLGCAKASRILHHKLLYHVLRSPMSFFDTTPIGRVTNRFSTDLDIADETLPQEITDFLWCFVEMVSTMIIICTVTPYFIIEITLLMAIFSFIIYYYIGSSRQLKRLESICRSPVLSHLQESLSGAVSIRSYESQDRFIQENEDKLEEDIKCSYLSAVIKFWLGTRTDFLGSLIVAGSALLAAVGRVPPGMAGLSVTYAFEVLEAFTWMVFMACNLETNSVCLERIMEYFELEQEAPWKASHDDHTDFDPTDGQISFNRYSTRYRQDLDLALSHVSFDISSGEKIGICGRTGAGKSSITKALFRIIEASEGNINIDGTNICLLGLHDLREAITIIPQDPVLFCGTLRFNLDPYASHADSELWRSLELAHLKDHIQTLSLGLDHTIQERGQNFSVGERQLICLARALLKKSRILILDEATAAIDLETDSLIQKTIKKEFAHCTVLTIAHRLDTIMDSDRVMVLSEGGVVEMDSPGKLLEDSRTVFSSMAKSAGISRNPSSLKV